MIRPHYETKRLHLYLSNTALTDLVVDYLVRNKDFLKSTTPLREDTCFTADFQWKELLSDAKAAAAFSRIKFWIAKKSEPDHLIGMVALSGIIMGVFESAFLSYQLDEKELCQGFTTEAVEKCVELAFTDWHLHRVEANIMPRNAASLRVTKKLGFQSEGLARKYLKIAGVWEDHIHMVRLRDDDEPFGQGEPA